MGRRAAGRARTSRQRGSFGRRALGWLPDLIVVGLVVFAFVAWTMNLGVRWGLAEPDPPTPAEILPPLGLKLPALEPAGPVAQAPSASPVDPARLRAVLERRLADERLGKRVDAIVTDLASNEVLYRRGDQPVVPASTMKLLTGAAALSAMRPQTRFATTVERIGQSNQIVLKGGGDPFLMSRPEPASTYPKRADLRTLASRTATRLKSEGVRTVRLGYDDSLFTGRTFNKTWPASYRADVVPPIGALLVDGGRNPDGPGFVTVSSVPAATVFRTALAQQGIQVTGAVTRVRAPATADRLARVLSPTLAQVVARVLLVSDNIAAEVVAHHVGRAAGFEGSFRGGARGIRKTLTGLGVPLTSARIYDGSGLSRRNLLDPATQAGVLAVSARSKNPALRDVITGMPVAGLSGSLAYRFDTGARFALGRVQAKTGTLTGVHGLAGVATDRDGHVFGFVMIANGMKRTDELYAREQIDKIAGALADCACGRGT